MRHALPVLFLTHAFSACSNKLNALRLRSKKFSAKVAVASLVLSQFTTTGFAVLQPTPAFAAIQSCNSPDARMKVDFTDMIATRQETVLPQVHLGSSTVIPDNAFFSIRSGGTNLTDSTIRMDVPGLSAQRGNGWIKFLIESKGTPGRKGFTGNITIDGARFYGIATEGRPNKVERPFNGTARLGRITQDEIAIENDNLATFTLTVGPSTDSFTLYYEPVNCPIVQNADISFQKIGPTSVNRGENITYDFIVRNLTGVQANAITIIDTVPAGLTYNYALSEIKQCTQQGQTLTCGPLGNILPNATNQGKVVFTTSSTMNCGTITNTARVTTSTQESSTTNNQSSYQTTINCPTTPTVQCNDGLDNDSDGLVDFPNDPGCSSTTDTTENNGAGGGTGPLCPNGGPVNMTLGSGTQRDISEGGGESRPLEAAIYCPNGTVATSLMYKDFPLNNNSDYMDGVTLGCSPVSANGTISPEQPRISNADITSNPREYATLTCPNGQVITSIFVKDLPGSDVMDGVTIACSPFIATGVGTEGAALANGDLDTNNRELSKFGCPANTVVGGIAYNRFDSTLPSSPDATDYVTSITCTAISASCPVTPQCRDGIDNDNDGAIDLADFSCSNGDDNDETNPKSQCQDGIDNDNDGKIDFPQDPGCASKQDNDEFNEAPTSDVSVSKSGPSSVQRGNTITYTIVARNNGPAVAPNVEVRDPIPAGLTFIPSSNTDCSQQGSTVVCPVLTLNSGQQVQFPIGFQVSTQTACNTSIANTAWIGSPNLDSNTNNNQSTFTTTVTCAPTPQCKDGIDNDNDGATDYPNDFSCSNPDDNDETNPKSQCQDGIDNDSDGKIDYPQDPGCASKQDNDEYNAPTPTPQCKDGIDNDNDGAVDLADFSCSNGDDNDETNPKSQCQDGIDNDSDGKVDFGSDPGCSSKQDNDEYNAVSGGPELHITKSGPATVNKNGTITYTVFAENTGTQPSFDTVVVDNFPADVLTYIPSQSTPGCTLYPTYVHCIIGDFGPGETRSFSFTFSVKSAASCNSTFQNKADIQARAGVFAWSMVQTTVNCPQTTQCSDGVDNDSDGKIDYPADPGCSSAQDNDEYNAPNPQPQCNDGIDNDSDGKIDYPQDPGCSSSADNDEYNSPAPSPQCSDGIDNDSDGKIDYPQDPGCTNGQDNDETNTPPTTGPKLEVTKTGPTTVAKSGTITYQILATNSGDAPAQGVVVADHFPIGQLEFLPALSTPGCTLQSTFVLCIIGEFASQQSKSFTLAFKVKDSEQCNATIMNKVDLQASGGLSAWDDAFTTVTCAGGLDIQKTGPSTVTAGNQITYNFVIANNGSTVANNVIISDFYIDGALNPLYTPPFTYLSASGATCTYNNGNVACSFGNMNPGQTKNFSLTFQTPANQYCGQVVMNQSDIAEQGKNSVAWSKHPVTVQCPSAPLAQCKDGIDNDSDGKIDYPADPGCANADDNDETNPPTTGAPDLHIDKTGPETINPNGTITYQVLAQNFGSVPSQGTVVADHFPADLVFVPGSSTPGCRLEAGFVLCEIGEFAAQQSKNFTFVFTVKPTAACGSTLMNQADLQAAGGFSAWDKVQTTVQCN